MCQVLLLHRYKNTPFRQKLDGQGCSPCLAQAVLSRPSFGGQTSEKNCCHSNTLHVTNLMAHVSIKLRISSTARCKSVQVLRRPFLNAGSLSDQYYVVLLTLPVSATGSKAVSPDVNHPEDPSESAQRQSSRQQKPELAQPGDKFSWVKIEACRKISQCIVSAQFRSGVTLEKYLCSTSSSCNP